MPSAGTLEERQQAAREHAQALLGDVFRRLPQGQSKHARSNYRGDRTVLQSFGLPSAKQLPPHLLESNFFHHFLHFAAHPADAAAREALLLAKLEPERFQQWAAPEGITLTQVTPTATAIPDARAAFDQALSNIFSAALKPLDTAKFVRAVKCRFRVSRFVAHTQGPDGLFRPDVPETFALKRFDRPHDMGVQQGRFVFGSIVLVLVHHQLLKSEHALFALATGPFKHGNSPETPTPTHLTARTAVNWAPGVNFAAVESWWSDLMMRPALRREPDTASDAGCAPALRLAGLFVPPARPMACGARLLRTALADEFSVLRAAVKDRACEPAEAALEPITDAELETDPVQPAASSDVSLVSEED